mmetsp:Transcript_64707/g.90000  ORF Transcript_64707/g.90000 Transcript_64707/m.90000 type:complete len:91 (+) Transcript_64707:505-777(+)
MVFLPALCRKMEVPYCFVKGKARLGQFVHQKTATALALTEVRKEDYADLEQLRTFFNGTFNENVGIRRIWGGGVLGQKHHAKMARFAKKD